MPKEVVFTEDFLKKLKSFQTKSVLTNVGYIASLGDGVVEINGLSEAGYNEILEFTHDVFGVVFNLGEDRVGSIILGDFEKLQEGDEVKTTGRILEIPVSEHLIGRVVDPLARPLDGKGEILAKKAYPLEKIAPGVIQRQSVNTPLQTGIKAIDSMIPIGRGQRELIIGDRGTGKTALVIDTIMNQKDQEVVCIYVSIGQKTARLRQIIDRLEKYKAFDYTIVVAANASDPTSLQYIAPYAGVAIGEYFMDQGRDVLIVYDDLTKHAWAYRQISLLMRRPSGREA
ncbi:F0F1 ATP synthase subunit alpha, partial [candidate division WWE3 bacterium CG_4_8_14_3_um_filter_42_11]